MPGISDRPLQVALRTYTLALALSLGPSLFPFLIAGLTSKKSPRTSRQALNRLLRANFGLDGFPFSVTLSVAGGAAMTELWSLLDSRTNDTKESSQKRVHKTFIANAFSSAIGILLLHSGRRHRTRQRSLRSSLTHPSDSKSDTLDLTLLLFIRAADAILQAILQRPPGFLKQKQVIENEVTTGAPSLSTENLTRRTQSLSSAADAFIFWACSARIMWCWFYEPQRLPRSYVKWIATLANLDHRVAQALRLLRIGGWSYIRGSPSHRDVLTSFAKELGYPASWGDPVVLPAYGGAVADRTWKLLGVKTRPGMGGLPCELVHGSVGSSLGLEASCTANASIRGLVAFSQAIAIYLPVHFLPALLTRPKSLLDPQRTLATMVGAFRSATFLSTFVALYWYAVCVTRTLAFARLFPSISHDFWDGPFGCIFMGCLACGSSIWIENGRRRGEMALYVLPRAIRSCLPDAWLRNSRKSRLIERIAFVLSFSTLMSTATHHPEALRGLSRWTLSFIMNGPKNGLWKRKTQDGNGISPPPTSRTQPSRPDSIPSAPGLPLKDSV